MALPLKVRNGSLPTRVRRMLGKHSKAERAQLLEVLLSSVLIVIALILLYKVQRGRTVLEYTFVTKAVYMSSLSYCNTRALPYIHHSEAVTM